MKIAIMGAGALGGYFGGRLAAAGHDVTLIARGAHLAAIKANGLRIQSPKGDLHLPEVAATDDPASVGLVDVVMFMVKTYDLDQAAQAIRPMLGPQTMVTTFQNGISAPDRLGAVIGAQHVVPGVARIPADIMAPGVIRHSADWNMLQFGETDGISSGRCAGFAKALTSAGVDVEISPKIRHTLWRKFIMQASLASITALTRLDLGPIRANPAATELFRRSTYETATVGRAEVPDLPSNVAEEQWQFITDNLPDTMHASMLDDLLRGKRIEIDDLSGEVVRLGRKHGIPTPIHEVFNAALQPFANGAPG